MHPANSYETDAASVQVRGPIVARVVLVGTWLGGMCRRSEGGVDCAAQRLGIAPKLGEDEAALEAAKVGWGAGRRRCRAKLGGGDHGGEARMRAHQRSKPDVSTTRI
jgi:hypothetical protein